MTGIAGGHDDANAAIVQPAYQVVGPLPRSQMNVDKRRVREAPGDQAIGVGRRRYGSGHVCSAGLKQGLYRYAKVPRIFDYQDAHAIEIRASGLGRIMKFGRERPLFRDGPLSAKIASLFLLLFLLGRNKCQKAAGSIHETVESGCHLKDTLKENLTARLPAKRRRAN